MGYSNQTPNFGFPQYAMGDVPAMDDYNRAFGVIDENLGKGSGGGAVESVFGRTGEVTAQTGDYTADMVGAIPNTAGAVSTANLADESVTLRKLAADVALSGGGSNINLLDNWYFIPTYDSSSNMLLPINQRNIVVNTAFTTAGAYFIDRWILVSGSVTLTAAGLVLDGTIRQKREFALGTDDFTASVFAVSGTATAEYDDTLKYFDVTSEGGTIVAAKLELGDKQTLTKNDGTVLNDPPPNVQQELAKCQRYQIAKGSSMELKGFTSYMAISAISITIPIPVPMRVTPTAPNGWVLYNISGAEQTGFTLSSISRRANGITFNLNKTSHGLTNASLNVPLLDANL